MIDLSTLLEADQRALWGLLREGHPIDPAALDDSEYRGVSLGLPAWIEALSWKTFMKTFHRDRRTGALRGWNVRLEQTGLDGPVVPKRRGEAPRTLWHYAVVPATGRCGRWGCENGLLLDYGLGGNAAWDTVRFVRDPLVALRPGDTQLLLGWSFIELGSLRFGTPSFFALERLGPLGHVAEPARSPVAHR